MKPAQSIALLFVLTAVWWPAQAQAPPDPAGTQATQPEVHKPLYRIAGTLVDAVTGDPVPRATISALSTLTHHALEATQTDDEGHFQLKGLPAGKYGLLANKVNYRSTEFDTHQNFSSAIVTGEGQATEDLRFPITPAATLQIHIVDDRGEPVEGAVLTLALRVHGTGIGDILVPHTYEPTGITGTHHMYMLAPGEYYLAVSAHPWYAMHNTVEGGEPGEPHSANPALDVAYPVAFYDNATSETNATPIHLAPGAHEEITVALHAVPALRLSIPPKNAVGAEEESGPPAATLHTRLFGSEVALAEQPQSEYDEKGNLTLGGIAPGEYELLDGEPQRRVELNLSASTAISGNSGAGVAALKVRVHAPEKESLPQDLKLQLNWRDKVHPQLPHRADIEAGKCSFDTLPPGDWDLELLGRLATVPILSISVNGKTTATNRIHVGEKPIRLDVTARASALRAEGFALNQGRGEPGVLVLLVPVDLRNHSDWLRIDQSDSDGSFSFPATAPGDYTLIALENAWDLEWQSPEFLSRFLPNGVAVTIPDQPTGIYRLPVSAKIQSAVSQPAEASAEGESKQN